MSSKTCFVTAGATASFPELIGAVLSPLSLNTLEKEGYTDLVVQYGEDGKGMFEAAKGQQSKQNKIKVSGFDIDKAGLGKYMRQAKGIGASNKDAREGCVISHAGSGTILDALRTSIPTIVVPNESLLDNHQLELAQTLAEMEYVVHGDVGNLGKAIEAVEKLRGRAKEWPPVNSKDQGFTGAKGGLRGVLDEEMGYLD